MRLSRATPPPQPSLDIGQTVRVETWNADGTARVNYRGTTWDAELATPDVPHAATMYIVATRGSRLILSDRRPSDLTGRGHRAVIDSKLEAFAMWLGSSLFTIALFVVAVIIITRAIRVVPQQHALVIERLGRFYAVLQPGLNFVIPFVDRVAYRHDLREIPFDVPSQICITKDNTQLQVDGILYFQVTDPRLASYGSSNFQVAITQLAQTTLRSVIGRMELDRTFEERDHINGLVVAALDQAAANWGVKVLRYEIKDLTPPKEILHAMQAQITAEREKRAVIATSEGKQQEQINLANGARAAAIAKSEGEKQAEINQAQGHAAALLAIAEANAKAIRQVAESIEAPGGLQAVNLKVAEQYVAAFANIAKTNNTVIVPANLSDLAGLITSAMTVFKAQAK